MRELPDLDPAFRVELARRCTDAAPWLEALPQTWLQLAERWNLRVAGRPRTGMTSVVVPVEVGRPSRRAAVKLVSPVVSAADEATALSAFAGHGTVRLLDAEVECGALLLEWLDGPPLSECAERDEALRVAGRLAAELNGVAAPPGAPTLAAQARTWLPQLRRQHETARDTGDVLPDTVYRLATKVIADLTEDRTATLTHGDLSMLNILRSGRGWVAIDPLLLAGPAAWEAHTVTRSHLSALVAAPSPERAIAQCTRRFTEAAELDDTWASSLSLARFVASYYWESQNGGNTGNTAALRAATLATATALGC